MTQLASGAKAGSATAGGVAGSPVLEDINLNFGASLAAENSFGG